MNQFGIEDIFPHSIIHLEALVGDSYELLMWQKKGKEEEVEEIARKFYFNDFYYFFIFIFRKKRYKSPL